MRSKIFRTVLLVGLLAGCSNHRLPPGGGIPTMSDLEIYQRIQLGMTEPKVQEAVGRPHAPVSYGLALYGGVPEHSWHGMPFNILIVYSNKVVVSKVMYVGHDEHHEGVYPLYFGYDKGADRPKGKGSGTAAEAGKVIH